jgi:hypothetical protein
MLPNLCALSVSRVGGGRRILSDSDGSGDESGVGESSRSKRTKRVISSSGEDSDEQDVLDEAELEEGEEESNLGGFIVEDESDDGEESEDEEDDDDDDVDEVSEGEVERMPAQRRTPRPHSPPANWLWCAICKKHRSRDDFSAAVKRGDYGIHMTEPYCLVHTMTNQENYIKQLEESTRTEDYHHNPNDRYGGPKGYKEWAAHRGRRK